MNMRFIGALALLCSVVAQAGSPDMVTLAAPKPAYTPPSILWRAQRELVFEMIDNDWAFTDQNDYVYNQAGLATGRVTTNMDQVGGIESMTRTTTTYGNGNRYFTRRLTEVSTDRGLSWTPSQLVERTYDPVVPGVITENADYNWDGMGWLQNGNNYRRLITRNDKGNVTSVIVSTLYNGIYDPVDRLTITYGDDDRAVEILHEVLTLGAAGDLVWGTAAHYANIKWERTDGQITNVEDLPTLANRMESANVRITATDYGYLTFTYPQPQYPQPEGSYRSTLRGTIDNIPATITASFDRLDEIGSYDYECITTSGVGAVNNKYVNTEHYHLDEYGLEILIYVSESLNGVEEVVSNVHGLVEYDSQYGYPLEYVVRETDADDPSASFDVFKVIYQDYVDCTGVESVSTDLTGGSPEYYDLHGRKVTSPAPGHIYILRNGATTGKVVYNGL